MRGTWAIDAGEDSSVRATPACAGNITPATGSSERNRNHSRLCGKHEFRRPVELTDHPAYAGSIRCERVRRRLPTESPPRMRGASKSDTKTAGQAGITPAYAGSMLLDQVFFSMKLSILFSLRSSLRNTSMSNKASTIRASTPDTVQHGLHECLRVRNNSHPPQKTYIEYERGSLAVFISNTA